MPNGLLKPNGLTRPNGLTVTTVTGGFTVYLYSTHWVDVASLTHWVALNLG